MPIMDIILKTQQTLKCLVRELAFSLNLYDIKTGEIEGEWLLQMSGS
jgi:hypothetical protein